MPEHDDNATPTNEAPEPVSLRPTDFTEEDTILEATMEEVVNLFLVSEQQRARTSRDDENQQVCVIGCRVIPTGLIMSLDSHANSLGLSRGLLTRCLSHQVVAWYNSQPRINELVNVFNIARDAANDYGYPDLYDGLGSTYVFANTSPRNTSFRSIQWVRNSLSQMSRPLYSSIGTLFVAGLCFSLTKATRGGHGTAEKFLAREVDKFQEHVEEQFIRVSGFHDLIRRRARAEGKFPQDGSEG